MKAIKRTVAGLLATLMFASCFSFNFAFGADNYTDDEAIAVSKVNAANIMTGTDNGFEPSKTLTRAEAAAIVVRMKGVPASQVEGAKGNTLFTDVPASSWAAGYINAASAMGIISGVGNGLFLPEREVSIVEFSAMAIRALGAGKLVDSIGTWPTNYVNFATEEKLFDGVLKAYTAPATRMDVAFMVVNTIEANMWEKTQVTNTSEVTYAKQVKPAKTLLGDVLKITEYESLSVDTLDTKEREITFKDKDGVAVSAIATFDVVDGVELASLRSGHEVDVWVKAEDKEIIRIAPAEKSKVAKVSFSKIEKIDLVDNEITLLVDGKEKTYKYATHTVAATPAAGDHARANADSGARTTACTVCNAPANVDCTQNELVFSYNSLGTPAIAAESNLTADPTVIKLTAGGKALEKGAFFGTAVLKGNTITTIYAEKYENKGVVKEIKNDNIYFENNSKVKSSAPISKFEMDDEDIEYVVTKDGKEIDITDIEKGDALYFYQDTTAKETRYVIAVNNKSVTGTAKQVSTDKYVKVDGTKYELAIPSVDISAGSEVKLYLNAANKVTMYEIIDGAVDSTVALVKSLRKTAAEYVDGAQNLEIVLVQLDGTELDAKVVDLEESVEKFEGVYFNDANSDGVQANTGEDDYFANETALEGAIYNATNVRHTFIDGSDADTKCDVCDAATAGNCNKKSIVGTMIRYTLKGGKVVIREFVDEVNSKVASSFDKKEIEKFSSENYSEENGRLGSSYRLNDDTTIYVAKTVSGSAKAYSVKFEKVDFEDLGSSTGLNGYVLSKDKNTNLVKAVLFLDQPSRATDKNYAIVLDKCNYNGDEEDYSEEVTLLLNDGSVVEVLVPDDLDVTLNPNVIIEAFIAGDKLEDATEVVTGLTDKTGTDPDKYNKLTVNVVSFNGDGTLRVFTSSEDRNIDIAENCMFVMKEDDGDLIKGSEGKVPTISDNDSYSSDADKVVDAYLVYNSETKSQEVIALVYNED